MTGPYDPTTEEAEADAIYDALEGLGISDDAMGSAVERIHPLIAAAYRDGYATGKGDAIPDADPDGEIERLRGALEKIARAYPCSDIYHMRRVAADAIGLEISIDRQSP